MKLLRRNKKGFTIVELVIVIAVIGILAAVLIPTFVNLNNKANKAADESLVKNLNTALAMKEQDSEKDGGGKNNTFHDAVEDLKEYGYLLPNLVTKAEDKLLWNQNTNRFILENDDKGDYKLVDFWRIQDSIENNQQYSVYAGVDFKATNGVVDIAVGFDAGYHKDLKAINYVHTTGAAQTVTIRTNGSEAKLTVNGPLDTIHHFDYLDELTVTAVDPNNSYHEHGTIRGKATISSGHFVVESGSDVEQVVVSNATGDVKVTANESTAIFVDEDSADQASVVANAEGIFVAGVDAEDISGQQAGNVVKPVLVMDETQLIGAASAKNSFVQLGDSFSISNYVVFGHDVVLDLNGHQITAPSDKIGLVFSNDVAVLTDSVGTGKVTAGIAVWAQLSADLSINGGTFIGTEYALRAVAQAKVTVNGGVFEAENNQGMSINTASVVMNNGLVRNTIWGVTVWGNGSSGSVSFVMNGGKIIGSSYAISGNGTAQYSGTIIEIHGGELESTSNSGSAIYHPQNGTLKIDGNPTLKGASSVYIKSGTTTIAGGKFITTLEEKAEYEYSGNGANATGDAIVIDACNYPGGNPCVEAEIKNATFELADSSARKVAYYSHENGAAVVIVDGKTLDPIIG